MIDAQRRERGEHLGLLARRVGEGDRAAADQLVLGLRDDVYRLALRMTGSIHDAEDATQEVLLKIITRLGSWRGDALITTWAHRITVNHLLDRQRSPLERLAMTFDDFATDLREGLTVPSAEDDALQPELLDEVRLGCTLAMLQCLDREHRIAYVLVELFDVTGEDAAWICEISHATLRKRVSRARARVRTFMQAHCGLVVDNAACRCARRVETAITLGRVDPSRLQFAAHATNDLGELRRVADSIDDLRDHVVVLRNHPDYATSRALTTAVFDLIGSTPLLRSRTPQ